MCLTARVTCFWFTESIDNLELQHTFPMTPFVAMSQQQQQEQKKNKYEKYYFLMPEIKHK